LRFVTLTLHLTRLTVSQIRLKYSDLTGFLLILQVYRVESPRFLNSYLTIGYGCRASTRQEVTGLAANTSGVLADATINNKKSNNDRAFDSQA
jgi:hypothetical protein